MVAALAETLRLSADPRERRAALRRSAPDREAVRALLAQARDWRRRDPQSATRIARAALLVARAGKAPDLAAEAAHVLGQAEVALGRPRHALRRQRAAAQGADPSLRVSVAIETASALMLLGHETEARSALADARRMAKGRQRAPLLAVIDVTEANLLLRLDRDVDALALFARARPLAARRKRMAALAAIDTNRATALANLHRYEAADRIYTRTARTYRRLGEEAAALIVEYNRAYLQYLRGRLHRAGDELAALRERFQGLGNDRFVALCDLDLAEVDLRLGEPERAAGHARAATEALTRLGIAHDAARARLFLATAERALGRREEARVAMEAARDALRDVGAAAWEGVALQRLAEIDLENGLLDRAQRRASEAADRLLGLGLVERGGRAEVLAARVELARGKGHAARARLARLFPRIRALHAPWLAVDFHREAALAASACGRHADAVRHAIEAVRVLDHHRAVVPADEPLPAFHREQAATREVAVGLLVAAGGRPSLERALALARAAKARTGEAAPPDRGPRGAGRREARVLQGEIDGLLGRMPTDDPHRRAGVARRLADAALRKDRRLRALGPAAAPDPGVGPIDRPPPGTTSMEAFVTTAETFVFVRTRTRLRVVRLPVPRASWLEAAARAKDERREVASWVRREALDSLLPHAVGERVVLRADDAWAGLPWEDAARSAPPWPRAVDVYAAT